MLLRKDEHMGHGKEREHFFLDVCLQEAIVLQLVTA